MEKIFDIRFIVPPIFTLFFVFLFSPSYFLGKYTDSKTIEIIISVPIILALGIIISSIGNFILVKCNLRSSQYSKKEKQILKEIFFQKEHIDMENDNKNDSDILELGSWLVLSCFNEHLQQQIHKRWNWAVSGFNYCISIILAIVFILVGHCVFRIIPSEKNWSLVSIISGVVLFAIFFYNAENNRRSVRNMDRALVRNYKQISDKFDRDGSVDES